MKLDIFFLAGSLRFYLTNRFGHGILGGMANHLEGSSPTQAVEQKELTPERTAEILRSELSEDHLRRLARKLISIATSEKASLGTDGMKSIQEILRWLLPKDPSTVQSGEGSVQRVEFYMASKPDDLDDEDMVLLDED